MVCWLGKNTVGGQYSWEFSVALCVWESYRSYNISLVVRSDLSEQFIHG